MEGWQVTSRRGTLIIMIESFREVSLHIVEEIDVIHGGFLHFGSTGVGYKAISIMDELEHAYFHITSR